MMLAVEVVQAVEMAVKEEMDSLEMTVSQEEEAATQLLITLTPEFFLAVAVVAGKAKMGTPLRVETVAEL